ncbi:hypothetical protein [Massilia soli]|uniref:Uncharacterized protein n=1 Tax=Massilia soli TaxID=2792854 RepID=A0ABS7SVH7_9BURK|nr:hypothetical protein [Massilia soli]MBZ2209958.1 hypothetical protein [Massilia soli]
MKSTAFWIRRYFVVAGASFVLLVAVGLLKGREAGRVLTESLLWAVVTAAVFTAARYRSARKGQAGALCRDTPDD